MIPKQTHEKCCVCGEDTENHYCLTCRGFICHSCHQDWQQKGWESKFMKGVKDEDATNLFWLRKTDTR